MSRKYIQCTHDSSQHRVGPAPEQDQPCHYTNPCTHTYMSQLAPFKAHACQLSIATKCLWCWRRGTAAQG